MSKNLTLAMLIVGIHEIQAVPFFSDVFPSRKSLLPGRLLLTSWQTKILRDCARPSIRFGSP